MSAVSRVGEGSTKSCTTALLAVGSRWQASRRAEPLCDDPWAGPLAGEEGRRLAALFNCHAPNNELWIGLRTAYLDRQVRYHTDHEDGFTQVVVLGAGFDSRAARLARRDVTFFEVDHPQTQTEKLRRLRSIKGYPTDNAVYVACDFEREDPLNRLSDRGFQLDLPSLFLMEGVAPYLSEATMRRILMSIAKTCDVRSRLIFDFLHPKLLRAPTPEALMHILQPLRDDEPIKWTTESPLPLLEELGFAYVHIVTMDVLCLSGVGSCHRGDGSHWYAFAHATQTTPPWAHVHW